MSRINVEQVVTVNVEELLEKTMIQYPYELFALLIRKVVSKADDPYILAKCIEEQLEQYKVEDPVKEKFVKGKITEEEIAEMKSLIDGAYEVVELHGYRSRETSPYNVTWAKDWCEKARKYGATPE